MSAEAAQDERTHSNRDAPASRWVDFTLFLMPILAALGPFFSLTPGAAGTLYGYRALIALAAIPAFIRLVHLQSRDALTRALFLTTAAFLVWGPLALGWTPNTERGGRQLAGILISLVGCWVAIGLAGDRPSARRALRRGFVAAALVLSGIGLWQYTTGQNLWTLTGQPFNFSGNPLIGTFVNPNNYGAFLLGCVGPIVAMAILGTFRHRLFGLGLVVLLAWVLVNTESRTGIFGLFIICVLACCIVGVKVPKSQAPMLVGAIALAGIALANLGRLRQLLGGVSSGNEASDDLRVQLSGLAFKYFLDSGLIGLGPAGFEIALATDGSARVSRVLPPHNTFLEIAAEYGVLVALPFFALMGMLSLAAVRRSHKKASGETARRVELLACLFAILAGAIVASSLIADPSWWLLIGYTVLLARPTSTVSAPTDDQDEERRLSKPTTVHASSLTHTSHPAAKARAASAS